MDIRAHVKRPLITANDSLSGAAKKIISQQTSRMRANAHGALSGIGDDALHNLRVASRRTRVALEVFGRLFGRRRTGAILSGLGVTGKILGQARDLDVLMAGLGQAFLDLDAPKSSQEKITRLLARERALSTGALRRSLRSKRYSDMLDRIDSLQPLHGAGAPYRASEASKAAIKKACRDIIGWKRTKPGKLSGKDLHRLRIAFKKLRYLCEFFSDLYGDKTAGAIKSLVRFQDTLGRYHDAASAAETLEALGRKVKIRQLDKLVSYENRLAGQARRKFLKLWKKFPDTPKGVMRRLGVR